MKRNQESAPLYDEREFDHLDATGIWTPVDGFMRGPGLEAEPERPTPHNPVKRRRKPVHLRHEDEPSESDEFWNIRSNYLDMTPDQRAEQYEINRRGAALVRAALHAAQEESKARRRTQSTSDMQPPYSTEEYQQAIDADWDQIEARITANDAGRLF